MVNYTFGMSLLDSIVGLLVVFFARVLLMCMIKIMTAIGDSRQKKAAAAAMPADLPAQPEAAPLQKLQPLAPGTAGDVKLYDTDPRTAAMLMAIVADELKAPINELRFLSIREIKEDA